MSVSLPTFDPEAKVLHVESSTHSGVIWDVFAVAEPWGDIRTSCNCPAGVHAVQGRNLVACKHGKALVDLLAVHGLAVRNRAGRWITADARRLEGNEGHWCSECWGEITDLASGLCRRCDVRPCAEPAGL